jgi:predicted Zn-dependent protease
MRRIYSIGISILAVVVILLIPVLAQAGGLKLFKMSKRQELEIAQEMKAEFEKEPGLITEGRYYNQVQRIGKKLVEKNGLDEYDYQFFVIKQEEVNAFATPAGYIYVSIGLLDYMSYDEAMLAGVMAHELGHAKDRHVAKGYEKAITGIAGLTLLDLILGRGGEDIVNALFQGGQFVYLKYNRDQEEWADRYGVTLIYGAGYDAYGLTRSLECLEVLYGSTAKIAEYMSTHPSTGGRIERTKRIAFEECGKEHGYLPIPCPPKDHPLREQYKDICGSHVIKRTQPLDN